MRVLAVVLIVSAIWLVLASVRDGRGAAGAAAGGGEAWMIDQHEPVVRLRRQAAIPSGHPLARLASDAPDRRGRGAT
jgi:hypothetical protein